MHNYTIELLERMLYGGGSLFKPKGDVWMVYHNMLGSGHAHHKKSHLLVNY